MTGKMPPEQAFCDGQIAFDRDKPLSANPHSAWDAPRYDAWITGWLYARDEDHRMEAKIAAHVNRQSV